MHNKKKILHHSKRTSRTIILRLLETLEAYKVRQNFNLPHIMAYCITRAERPSPVLLVLFQPLRSSHDARVKYGAPDPSPPPVRTLPISHFITH